MSVEFLCGFLNPDKYQGSSILINATTALLPIISNTLFTLIVILFDAVCRPADKIEP
jgi:hypothetical protein